MVTTYCQALDVSALLQTSAFDGSSTPTLTQVEDIINRKEARIDQKLMHAWRATTVTDLFVDMTIIDSLNGVRFDLPNYTINSLTKLEVWDGSAYVDYVATKTEGRDDDFWVDYKHGVIFIREGIKRRLKKPIRVTYVYGESSVDLEIEDLCNYMAAVDVLSMFQRNIRFTDDGGSNTSTMDQRVIHMKAEINKIFAAKSSISTI